MLSPLKYAQFDPLSYEIYTKSKYEFCHFEYPDILSYPSLGPWLQPL